MCKRIISAILAFFMSLFSAFPCIVGNNNNFNESFDGLVKPETWAMTDGLGRTMPMKTEVGEKDNTKFVGMFYWTWHTNFGSWLTPTEFATSPGKSLNTRKKCLYLRPRKIGAKFLFNKHYDQTVRNRFHCNSRFV